MNTEPTDVCTFLAWIRGPLSTQEAADAVGVSRRSWHYYESGRLPKPAVMARILVGLDMPAAMARKLRRMYANERAAQNVAKRAVRS
jgi:uncharacterized protein (DUF924 family)